MPDGSSIPASRFGRRRLLAWSVPLFFGLFSVSLGQDSSWDLRNYHLYNPYAWLADRIGIDLAPAQMQTYFPPLVDVPYFWLTLHAPAPLVAFVMGFLHGLCFLPLLAIGRAIFRERIDGERLAWCCALAGCTGVAFLAGVGTSSGDDLTALLVVSSFLLVVRELAKSDERRTKWGFVLAGLVMGSAVGLKLTNSSYAVAACAAIPFAQASATGARNAWRRAAEFGVAALAALAVLVGPWWWRVWSEFGNPFFPQFNALFRSPFAQTIGVAELRYFPRGLVESLFWPIVFTLDPPRVAARDVVQVLWPLVYAAIVALGVAYVLRRSRNAPGLALTAAERFLVAFSVVSFVVWASIFGTYRYLAPLELLAPLLIWCGWTRAIPGGWGRRIAIASLVVASLVGAVGWRLSGHAGFADVPFRVETPRFAAPERASVVKLGREPVAWMVPWFPPEVAFVGLGTGLPETTAFVDRAHSMMRARGGEIFALFDGQPGKPGVDPERHRAAVEAAGRLASDYGLDLREESCGEWAAYIGTSAFKYVLCELDPSPSAADGGLHAPPGEGGL